MINVQDIFFCNTNSILLQVPSFYQHSMNCLVIDTLLYRHCLQLYFKKSYGFDDKANNIATTSGSLFQIGSTTKAFTAFLSLLLVQDGKLNLDQPVTDVCQRNHSFHSSTYVFGMIDIFSPISDIVCHPVLSRVSDSRR
jgi:hypothetical protein